MQGEMEEAKARLRSLYHADPVVVALAIDQVSRLGPEEADWNVVAGLADVLERQAELREPALRCLHELAARGVDMRPVLKACVSALRKRPDAGRGWALAWLREARTHPEWTPLRLGTDAGFLAEILASRPGSPEAWEAVEWLEKEAKIDAPSLSVNLYIHWPETPGEELLELMRRFARIDPKAAAAAVRVRPERSPLDLEAALARIPEDAGPFLVVAGQYSPVPSNAVRVGVFGQGELLADLWLSPVTLEMLPEALSRWSTVRRGEWDVLYATGYSLAWTTDGPPFELWDPEGRLASQGPDGLSLRGREPIPLDQLDHVEGYLEPDWIQRGVRCCLKSGMEIPIASTQELSAAVDPTYDGIDLLVDASWVSSLAYAMGCALGVPVVKDPAL